MNCPGCGADVTEGSTSCDHCGSSIPQENLAPTTTEDRGFGAETNALDCESCGAQVVYDPGLGTASCPYCGSTKVIERDTEDVVRPEYIIPFQMDKDEAREKVRESLTGFFRPGDLQDEAKIEAPRAVYLPYWSYDVTTGTWYTGRAGIRKTRQVKSTDAEGNEVMKDESYIDWQPTSGWLQNDYTDVVVLATDKGLDRDHLENVEPFDMADREAYAATYLQGFEAEIYSMDADECWRAHGKAKIKEKEREAAEKKIKDTVRVEGERPDRVEVKDMNTMFSDLNSKYVLLPVFSTKYSYGEEDYKALVNGQSGTVWRQAPIDWLKVGIAGGIGAVVLGIIIALMVIFGGPGTGPDAYETGEKGNDTWETASEISLPFEDEELTLHGPHDEDWYKVVVEDEPISVNIVLDRFDTSVRVGERTRPQDPDLAVWGILGDADEPRPLEVSDGTGTVEQSSESNVRPGTYFVRVYWAGQTPTHEKVSTRYRLRIESAGAGDTPELPTEATEDETSDLGDGFEPNDTWETASEVTLPFEEEELSLHGPEDEDWYKVVVEDEPISVNVVLDRYETTLELREGSTRLDPDLEIRGILREGEDPRSLDTSMGIGSVEQSSNDEVPPGTYFVRVYWAGRPEKGQTPYRLRVRSGEPGEVPEIATDE